MHTDPDPSPVDLVASFDAILAEGGRPLVLDLSYLPDPLELAEVLDEVLERMTVEDVDTTAAYATALLAAVDRRRAADHDLARRIEP